MTDLAPHIAPLAEQIRALPGCSVTKARVLRLLGTLARVGRLAPRRLVAHQAKKEEAARLLAAGLSRREAIAALMARYAVHRSTAYRWVRNAD